MSPYDDYAALFIDWTIDRTIARTRLYPEAKSVRVISTNSNLFSPNIRGCPTDAFLCHMSDDVLTVVDRFLCGMFADTKPSLPYSNLHCNARAVLAVFRATGAELFIEHNAVDHHSAEYGREIVESYAADYCLKPGEPIIVRNTPTELDISGHITQDVFMTRLATHKLRSVLQVMFDKYGHRLIVR